MFYLANFDCEDYGFESFLLTICRIQNLSELLEVAGSFGLGVSYPYLGSGDCSYELQQVTYGDIGMFSTYIYRYSIYEEGDVDLLDISSIDLDRVRISELAETNDGIIYEVSSGGQVMVGLFNPIWIDGSDLVMEYKVGECKYFALHTNCGVISLYPSFRTDLLGGIPEDRALQIFEEISELYFQIDFEWYS